MTHCQSPFMKPALETMHVAALSVRAFAELLDCLPTSRFASCRDKSSLLRRFTSFALPFIRPPFGAISHKARSGSMRRDVSNALVGPEGLREGVL